MASPCPPQHHPEPGTISAAPYGPFAHRLHPSGTACSALMRAGSLGFVSGLIGCDPVSGELVSTDPAQQGAAVFDRLEAVLHSAGLSLEHLVQTTVYLTDFAPLPALDSLYRYRLSAPFPARTIVQVAGLPTGAAVQVSAVVDIYRPTIRGVATDAHPALAGSSPAGNTRADPSKQ